eukprot:Anaeramoba_ignava/a5252_220.p1 GENE.a5252_220~~a5252_220.p1  ORF type:complete len:392 (-),score=75.05 a5252_220:37-1212(-)
MEIQVQIGKKKHKISVDDLETLIGIIQTLPNAPSNFRLMIGKPLRETKKFSEIKAAKIVVVEAKAAEKKVEEKSTTETDDSDTNNEDSDREIDGTDDDEIDSYSEDDLFEEDNSKVLSTTTYDPNDYDKTKSFLPPVEEVEALSLLNPMQAEAMKYVVEFSKKKSEQEYPNVLKRAKNLHFKEEELQRTLLYIRDEAPINVHFDYAQTFNALMKDKHYRNLFETGYGRGGNDTHSRVTWEDQMFNKIYHDSKPFDRVKYGSLNIVNDPHGVKCVYSYGDSFLVLKKVRLRTTFTSQDSCTNPQLACCEYYCHVLSEFSDQELKAVMEVANKKVQFHDSNVMHTFKETQIHGPIILSEHLVSIVMNPRYKQYEKEVDRFAQKNNCKVVWMPK